METVRAVQEGLPGLHAFFLLLTQLGSEQAYVVLLALYYWLVDPSSGRRLGLLLGLNFALNSALKYAFDLPRPYQLDPSLATPDAVATGTGPGFPSSHAQGAVLFWGYLALRHPRRWLLVLSVLLIVLVGLSRVYLGVHFPLDVLGGAVIGLGVLLLGAFFPTFPLPGLALRLLGAVALLGASWWLGSAEMGRALGVVAGFWLCGADFTVPRTWAGRALLALLGLGLVFGLLTGLGVLLGELRHEPWGAFVRYGLVAYFAAEVWPRLMRRFVH
jgi:membrane-associated phospholipid phosphatase